MRRAALVCVLLCCASCLGVPIHSRTDKKPFRKEFLPYTWVEVPAGEETVLRGIYVEGNGPPVLFLYGSNMGIRGSRDAITMLHEAGYSVLCCDYRGTGFSSGRWWTSRYLDDDARALWEWLRRKKGEPAGVLGISIGAVAAAKLTYHESPPAAIVLDRPVSPKTVIRRWFEAFVGTLAGTISSLLVRASCDVDLERDLGRAQTPTLVVLPEDDVLHPPQDARKITALRSVTSVTVPGGHLSSHLVDRVLWRSTILDFLDRHLRPGLPHGGGRKVPETVAAVERFELGENFVRLTLDREVTGKVSILFMGRRGNLMARVENPGREFVISMPWRRMARFGGRLYAVHVLPEDYVKPSQTGMVESPGIDRSKSDSHGLPGPDPRRR